MDNFKKTSESKFKLKRMLTFCKEIHSSKQPSPIKVALFGIVIDNIDE
jgi:hypothetical protein